jgi:hypothetical protein
MSHIAEVYAKDLGVKIGKPTITEHFFPNTQDVYICCGFNSTNKSEQYNYWDIVNSLVSPILEKSGISILHIPNAAPKQKNFFIKNSLLYFGLANHYVNIANTYEVPSVSLLANLYESNFDLFNKAKILTPDFSETKPTFSGDCNRINEIKPERIAQAILDQLGIREKINFKTIKAGSNFHNQTVEIVPNFPSLSLELRGKPINIRGDLHWDLENIIRWCQYSLVNLYIDHAFDPELLTHMPNLKQVVYKYDERENADLTSFFKAFKKLKINLIIQTKNTSKILDIRLKYFDFNVIEETKPHEKINAAKYISKKKFISNAQVFNSESSANRLDKSNSFVYDEASSKELESLYLYDEE